MGFFKKFLSTPVLTNPYSFDNIKAQKELSEHQSWVTMMNDPEYQSIVNTHYRLIEEIESNYSVLYNLKIIDGPKMDNLINLCKKDIAIANDFIKVMKKYNQEIPINYPSFKRLALIYEKQEKYNNAIETCVQAIKLGFTNDGTKGTMKGRLAKLIKKSGIEITDELAKLIL